jgi:hypothetical protein
MKSKPIIAANFGVAITALGSTEFIIEDVKGQTRTIVFLPSALNQLGDTFLKAREALPPVRVMSADAIPKPARESARLAEKLSKIEHSKSAGYSVAVVPGDELVTLHLKQSDGAAAAAAMDEPTALRLIERLQAALATIESGRATKQ